MRRKKLPGTSEEDRKKSNCGWQIEEIAKPVETASETSEEDGGGDSADCGNGAFVSQRISSRQIQQQYFGEGAPS